MLAGRRTPYHVGAGEKSMSFRYQKRIKLGKGTGINLSKTGVSASKQTQFGSVGTRGFSIRTGIPGLTFRQNWGKGTGGLLTALVVGGVLVAALLGYNLVRLLVYGVRFLSTKIRNYRK